MNEALNIIEMIGIDTVYFAVYKENLFCNYDLNSS